MATSVDTVEKIDWSELPSALTDPMIATATSTAIRAYSIEVAPDSSPANCLTRFAMSLSPCSTPLSMCPKNKRSPKNRTRVFSSDTQLYSLLTVVVREVDTRTTHPRKAPPARLAGLFCLCILNAIERLQAKAPGDGKVHWRRSIAFRHDRAHTFG